MRWATKVRHAAQLGLRSDALGTKCEMIKAAKLVAARGGKVLLVKRRSDGLWIFLGGHLGVDRTVIILSHFQNRTDHLGTVGP